MITHSCESCLLSADAGEKKTDVENATAVRIMELTKFAILSCSPVVRRKQNCKLQLFSCAENAAVDFSMFGLDIQTEFPACNPLLTFSHQDQFVLEREGRILRRGREYGGYSYKNSNKKDFEYNTGYRGRADSFDYSLYLSLIDLYEQQTQIYSFEESKES